MNNKNKNEIDYQTLFDRIKETQKLPDEVVKNFLASKGKLKNKIKTDSSPNEKQN